MTASPCVSLAKSKLIIRDERNHPPRRSEAEPHWCCADLSTAAISDALHISAHTVRDHLKAVFDKVGVRSRRELVGLILSGNHRHRPDDTP